MKSKVSNNKELRILEEVEASPDITQRQLAQKVGIALGLTNALLRNLIKKGYLRSQQTSWKRWVYSLTPDGISHKIVLTVAYIRRFLNHYQTVRQILREQLELLNLHEESRVAILGTGEFAELVYLGLKEIGINEIDVFDSEPVPRQSFLGIPVKNHASLVVHDYDRVLISTLGHPFQAELENGLNKGEELSRLVIFFR